MVQASNPPILYPYSLRPATTPLIIAADFPYSDSLGAKTEISTSLRLCPSLFSLITISSLLAATAIASRLMEAAKTLPLLWSVWLPQTSVLPGALKINTSLSSPKSLINSLMVLM